MRQTIRISIFPISAIAAAKPSLVIDAPRSLMHRWAVVREQLADYLEVDADTIDSEDVYWGRLGDDETVDAILVGRRLIATCDRAITVADALEIEANEDNRVEFSK